MTAVGYTREDVNRLIVVLQNAGIAKQTMRNSCLADCLEVFFYCCGHDIREHAIIRMAKGLAGADGGLSRQGFLKLVDNRIWIANSGKQVKTKVSHLRLRGSIGWPTLNMHLGSGGGVIVVKEQQGKVDHAVLALGATAQALIYYEPGTGRAMVQQITTLARSFGDMFLLQLFK